MATRRQSDMRVDPRQPAMAYARRRVAAVAVVSALLGVAFSILIGWVSVVRLGHMHPYNSVIHEEGFSQAELNEVRARTSLISKDAVTALARRDLDHAQSLRTRWFLRSIKGVEVSELIVMFEDRDAGYFELSWTQSAVRAGWPFFAVSGELIGDGTSGNLIQRGGGIAVPPEMRVGLLGGQVVRGVLSTLGLWNMPIPTLLVPIRPIWSGLALNAVIAAAIGAVAWMAPRLYVFRRRMARGRCGWCKYRLAGLNKAVRCPECGRLFGRLLETA